MTAPRKRVNSHGNAASADQKLANTLALPLLASAVRPTDERAGANLLSLIYGAILAAQTQPLSGSETLNLKPDLQVFEHGEEPVDRRCDALPEPASFHEHTVENQADRTLIRSADHLNCQVELPAGSQSTFTYRTWRTFASTRACRKINRPVALMASAEIGHMNGPVKLSTSGPRQISNQQASDSNGSDTELS